MPRRGAARPAFPHYVWRVQSIPTIAWSPNGRALRILDQTALPEREVLCDLVNLDDVIDAICTLKVRGAPAIGVAAAMGLVVALENSAGGRGSLARAMLDEFAARLIASRPTAVNLPWAVNRMTRIATQLRDSELLVGLRDEAQQIFDEDVAMCARIGDAGLSLIAVGARVLTHCNAGALATAGIGTALAPIYRAHDIGRSVQVFANETRPLRQGARLTAWELQRAGVPVTVLPDSAAASLLRDGKVDLVIVGADRVAANGDVANKVGTYPLALAAREHHVPFYVALPWSTIDLTSATGNAITIEQRASSELQPLPPNVSVYNPAFDVTPANLVTAYITDRGLLPAPFTNSYAALAANSTAANLIADPMTTHGVPA